MGEIPKWLQKFIQRLMPSQTSSGDGAVQMGHVTGNVTNVQLTQHIYAAPPKKVFTDAHKEVLALMDPLTEPVRFKVLDFMRREFGTSMVRDLTPRDVYRVKMYVLKIRQATGL